MLRWMYACSLLASLGRTWNCCTIEGQIPPMTTDDTRSSPKPSSGSVQLRTSRLTKNSAAQTTAIHIRIVFAGSTALTSV
ncbi:unannotated protein [freshwater metagenome]|uniref:Unannotated protein n=1 Tax=freshwater metagenome TaxID=449393 RepID=A0A6J7JTD6_9ZZZZ